MIIMTIMIIIEPIHDENMQKLIKSQKSINPYERIDENFANNPINIDNNDYNNDNNNKTLIIMIIWIMKY